MNKVIIVHYQEDAAAIEKFESTIDRAWRRTADETRNAIISILGNLEDVDAVIARLMQNQEELAAAIVPFYGEAAATELARLLKEHITIAGSIITAVKKETATAELEATWAASAEALATFLDSADPENWPKAVVLDLLKKHAECTIKIATARFAKDWVSEFMAAESCKQIVENIAGAMGGGIVNKFPEYFVMQYSSRVIKKK